MRLVIAAIVFGCFLPGVALADDTCPADMGAAKTQLTLDTRLIAVTNLSVPADEYVSKEPDALEIVFLSKPEDGGSRVSDDGNVVFLSKDASETTQQDLTSQAFDIRMKRQYPAKCFSQSGDNSQ
jgi:hypothetical protein